MKDEHDKGVLAGLRELVGQVEQDLYKAKPKYMDAFFFPDLKNVNRLCSYISKARRSLKICVFNLTNDDIAQAIMERWKANVDVQIISDDECVKNKGSDIEYLAGQGIPVRTDDNPQYHMHNKFMIVDDAFVMTGSFNWTFQAGKSNQENILIVDHPYFIEKYTTEFSKLWC